VTVGWPARTAEVVVWWAACLGIWLVSLAAVSGSELLVATCASLPCGVLATAGRQAAQERWTLRPRWLLPLLVLPVAIVTDAVQVLASVLPGRRDGGHFTTVAIRGGAGDEPAAAGRRALATLIVSASPGSIIADIDRDSGEALVHVLAGGGPRMERLATR
jgi:multisubunit Na+/H+ antiporter MnhE subunit